jgi:hypothetical protein
MLPLLRIYGKLLEKCHILITIVWCVSPFEGSSIARANSGKSCFVNAAPHMALWCWRVNI